VNDQEWLAGLKEGDEVAVTWSSFCGVPELGTVTQRLPSGRLEVKTPTRGPLTFNPNGRERTSYDRPVYLDQPTPELRDDIERECLRNRLRAIRWQEQPLAVLRRVAEALEEEGEGDA
jgi:hypothetical protein